MRFFAKDLRVKITVILLSFVLVSLLAAAVISHALVARIVRDSIERSALDSARLAGNIVESALERRVALVELLSNYPVLRDPAAAPASKAGVLSLFVEGYPLGKGAVITDTGGGIVAGTGKLAGVGGAEEAAWFVNAESAVTFLTFVYQVEALAQLGFDEDVLAVSTPVRDSNNQLFAYLALFTSLDDINGSVKAVRVKSSGHGFLITSTGTLVSGYLFIQAPKRPC